MNIKTLKNFISTVLLVILFVLSSGLKKSEKLNSDDQNSTEDIFMSKFQVSDKEKYRVVYKGNKGSGKGKNIVFISTDHEYRGEESLPALARILAKR